MHSSIGQGQEGPKMQAHLKGCKNQVNNIGVLKKQNILQKQMDEDIKKLLKLKKFNFIPLDCLVISHKNFKVLAVFLFFSLTRQEISKQINKKDDILNKIISELKDNTQKPSQVQISILNKLKITKVQPPKNQQSKCLVEQFIRKFSNQFNYQINFNFDLYQRIASVLNQMECVSLLRKIFSGQLPQISIIINKDANNIAQIYKNEKNVQNLQNCVIIKKYSKQNSKIIIYSQIQNRLDLQNQGMTAQSKIKLDQKMKKTRSQQQQQQLRKNKIQYQSGFNKKKQTSSEIQIPTSQKTPSPPKPQSQISSKPQTLQPIRDSNEQHQSSDPPAPAKPAIPRANTLPTSPNHQPQQQAPPPYPGSRQGSSSGQGSGSGFNRSHSLNNQTTLEQRIQIPEKYRLSWFEFAILIIILFAFAGQFGLLDNVLKEYNRNVGRYYGIETGYRIGRFFYGKVVNTNATSQL